MRRLAGAGARAKGPFSRGIATAWEYAAERYPDQRTAGDRPPDIDPDRDIATFSDQAQFVREVASWLREGGVESGDRVAIIKANHSDIVALSCAAARIGAVPAQIACTHSPEVARELLARLDRPVLVTDRARMESCGLGSDEVAKLVKRIIVVDAEPGSNGSTTALADLRGGSIPPLTPRPDDEAMVITHTSGTTGTPKLVAHSAATLRALSAVESKRWPVLGLKGGDSVLFCDPFVHGRVFTGLAAVTKNGPRLTMLSDPVAPNVRDLLVEHRPTVIETVPNAFLLWEAMADDPGEPFRDVRLFINTFDAVNVRSVRTLLNASKRRFPLWVQGWGQTEAGPVTLGIYTRRSVRDRGGRMPATRKVGRPVPFITKVRAVDPDTGRPLGRGRAGLIEVHKRGCALGYVGEDDRFQSKRNDGWWNMGDLGVVSRTNEVQLLDREVDRIDEGSCLELEDVLLDRMPSLVEAVMLAVNGGPPLPVLNMADGQPLDPDAWKRAVADLPELADPVVLPWSDVPRTATWKVQRQKLREQVAPGTEPVGSGRWT
ncbi:MAG TPA: class I adenylate-forming enzyme family protein [Thermoleophilaceae bacterium]|jgi:acyl-coenzyme A synthetase/AMP-(fatty) acid ligase